MRKLLVITLAGGVLAGAAWFLVGERARHDVRVALLTELQPVVLSNCDLQRFGGANDGGYLMCANLSDGIESAYSYGIGGHDAWGCDVSRRYKVPVHQYDCFNPTPLTCDGGEFRLNAECIGPRRETVDGRLFDTLTNQIARNGDAGRRLLVKIDVEGAEWDSLMATSDEVLARIDQLPMELHGVDEQRFIAVLQKLKRTFHLVHLHFNNWACTPRADPLPATAYQVLFVNKRLGVVNPAAPAPTLPRAQDAPDNPGGPDCQLYSTAR